ncbi:polysaccharide pyruvyl transferase family protein [Acinetobacter lwoffii]|uniref:polysaccharide pyruvyl transferase family protein n=1 Tax=Acinetobacter lwoffii TaxID=28090 RepID=UPI00110CA1ED|nr:polysaccharide pyruvyl transferase family protein [Acinetobacter lwoffii]TMS54356.1 polysaccharide pyruvyl transferase family protein [Acinetobacter lwoffii]
MSLKPKILLYGAYDRYNYGDNLMPILIEDYIKNYAKDVLKKFELEFVSVKSSDLSKYSCKKTAPIKDYLKAENVAVVMVVGGETMRAHIDGLFLNTFESRFSFLFALMSKKILRNLFTLISRNRYPSPWDYPYIPDKLDFIKEITIVLNTVGGVPAKASLNSIKKIDYISVRDKRSFNALREMDVNNITLVPDSVLLISSLYPLPILKSKISNKILSEFNFDTKYIVIQMSPHLASCKPRQLAAELLRVKKITGIEPILLPIGYASLHDDYLYLREVQLCSNNELNLFYDLSVWEIAYFIAKSCGYYGTSLHGAITAMSYGVPHYCINSKVEKFVSFVETWSLPCFSNAINPLQILDYTNIKYDKKALNDKVLFAQKIILDNYESIMRTIRTTEN